MFAWLHKSDTSRSAGSYSIWAPQIIDEAKSGPISEDAPPLFMSNPTAQCFVIGAFDGLGGSGARVLETETGRVTSAAHAARLAANTTAAVLSELGFMRSPPSGASPSFASRWTGAAAFRDILNDRLRTDFKREADGIEPAVAALRGTLTRRLPPTACLLVVEAGSREHRVSAIWAGDSRAYIWTSERGLIQLSRDHARVDQDAFSSIRQDVPMTNFVGPDIPFHLDLHQAIVPTPLLAICCSDGAFNYFPSPMEFEQAILVSILESDGPPQMTENLRLCIRENTKDDVTLVLVVVNMGSWQNLCSRARARWEKLAPLLAPIRSDARRAETATRVWLAAKDEHEAATAKLEEVRVSGWDAYRRDYESLQPDRKVGRED